MEICWEELVKICVSSAVVYFSFFPWQRRADRFSLPHQFDVVLKMNENRSTIDSVCQSSVSKKFPCLFCIKHSRHIEAFFGCVDRTIGTNECLKLQSYLRYMIK